MKLEKARKVLKKGDLVDKVDYFRYVLIIFICLFLVFIYKNGYMLGFVN